MLQLDLNFLSPETISSILLVLIKGGHCGHGLGPIKELLGNTDGRIVIYAGEMCGEAISVLEKVRITKETTDHEWVQIAVKLNEWQRSGLSTFASLNN